MRAITFLIRLLVGVLASLGLLVLVLALAIGFGWQRLIDLGPPVPPMPEAAVLRIDLSPGVAERRGGYPLALAGSQPVVLHEITRALAAAADDGRVKALTVRLGRGGVGLAQAQELHAAVRSFRDSGKPAYAFAETLGGGPEPGAGGTVHAYLASAFDEVWLQPSGHYALVGFRARSPYVRGLLDKLGIEPQLGQREAYKGTANQLKDDHMPAPQRANLQRMLDGWLDQVVQAVAERRELSPTEVRRHVDAGPLLASAAKSAGLIDRVGYRDEMLAAVRRDVGEEARPIDASAYAAGIEWNDAESPRIAVVYGLGMVALAESEFDPVVGTAIMGSDTVASAILAALEDDSVRGIVFRVDSPGGSYVASDTIWRAVRKARESDKPIVVSMGDVAASGGYFVSAPANRIVAQPGTLTGSIGVVSGKLVLSDLWEKIHVRFDGAQAGEQAGFWSPNQPFSDAQWQRLQHFLDETYADFKTKVASGRELSEEQVHRAAQGKIWNGADAHELGLVDELGGFHRAVALAKELAGIAPGERVRLVPFPEPEGALRRLLRGAMSGGVDASTARMIERSARILRPLATLLERVEGTYGDPRLLGPQPASAPGGDRPAAVAPP